MEVIRGRSKSYRGKHIKHSLVSEGNEIGYAISRPTMGEDSTGLSELFIQPEFQGKGYSKLLINDVINSSDKDIMLRANPYKNKNLSKSNLEGLYSSIGFKKEDDGRMRFSSYKDKIEKRAATKWKEEYANLSSKNKNILKNNVMKSNEQIANGVQKGNDNLVKKFKIIESFDNNKFQSIQQKDGKRFMNTPTSLADIDVKNINDLSKTEKAMYGAFEKFTGVKKLDKGDKNLFNAVSRRNAINKGFYGFEGQMIGEGAYSPYYNNSKFPKKLKATRFLAYGGNRGDAFKDYGKKISVNKDLKKSFSKAFEKSTVDLAKDNYYEGFPLRDNELGDAVFQKFRSNKDKYNSIAKAQLKKTTNAKRKALGLAGLGAIGGLSYLAKHKSKNNKIREKKERE